MTEILEHGNVKFTINSKLVRGLDYYGKTVYEWTTTELGTQDTVCAGGRYDNLIENHGSASTPAVGFAIGIERLLELINFKNILDKSTPDIYLLVSGKNTEKHGLLLAEEVRNQLPDVKILTNCGNESLKSQFKKADKSGAEIALILAEDELEKKELTVKYLRKEKAQITIKWNEISNFLNKTLFN